MVLGGEVEGPFIGAARRWSGRGALVPAGELRGAPLMAFGVAVRGSAIRGGDAMCDTSGVSTFKYNQCTLVKVKRKI